MLAGVRSITRHQLLAQARHHLFETILQFDTETNSERVSDEDNSCFRKITKISDVYLVIAKAKELVATFITKSTPIYRYLWRKSFLLTKP
jgi:hypothetical protein